IDEAAGVALLPAAVASGETELALRRGAVLVPRLARARGADVLEMPEASTWRLEIRNKGTLDALGLVAHPEASARLLPGQLRIAVRASGLNFRDVLTALGMYPGEAGPMGLEGAGVVLDVAPDVHELAPGDRVMGFLSSAFGPVAIADRSSVMRMPV